jgi:hypothetical protein
MTTTPERPETETDMPDTDETGSVAVLNTEHPEDAEHTEAETATVVEPVEHTESVDPDAAPESFVDDAELNGASLFAVGDVEGYRKDWRAVQIGFVEDPEAAIRAADDLIGRLVDNFTARIAARRAALSSPPVEAIDDRTEDLRLALRRYRTLLEQLLTADPS